MLAIQRQYLEPMASQKYTLSHPHAAPMMYAIPAQRPYGTYRSPGKNELTFAEHELLRSRKTPHGRIDERFDEILDNNVDAPASKHVLLSLSPTASNEPRPILAPPYNPGPQIQLCMGATNGNADVWTMNNERLPNPSRPPWEHVGVDSVLQQANNGNYQKYHFQPGSQVPTVLPAALHSYLGPTASAAQERYGPYWPDGTFNPYRPAPVRNNQYFGDPTRQSLRNVSSADARTLRRPGRLPTVCSTEFVIPSYSASQDDEMSGYRPFYERVFKSTGNNKEGPHRDIIHGTSRVDPCPPYLTTGVSGNNIATLAYPPDRLRPVEASDQIAFRDRTFTWAYEIYVDLLQKIQQENKIARPTAGAYGQNKRIIKPTIFPKPPQRSGSHFRDPHSAIPRNNTDKSIRRPGLWSCDTDQGHDRPQTAIRRPERQSSEHNDQHHRTPQRPAAIAGCMHNLNMVDNHRVSDPYIPTTRNYQRLFSPSSAATSALDTMELLCEEADKPWTDGMLLAGCLAYGLGNYSKALYWYQRVLAQDPRHIEAISNLAATLLALGRRDEALQNWLTAVKMRPSYFEAVEHLIGLLCAANRAKDAVEIIDYVESYLRLPNSGDISTAAEVVSDAESDTQSRSSSIATANSNEQGIFDFDTERRASVTSINTHQQTADFGTSGYAIHGCDNGRLLALIHARGNMLYSLGENTAAAASFEDAILIATGHRHSGIRGLVQRILYACVSHVDQYPPSILSSDSKEPILLSPERARQTVKRMFPPNGELPGLEFVQNDTAHRAAISTTSNSLLSLAKIYQDGMNIACAKSDRRSNGTREILALYYLSLSLQCSPSTANNVGILLASVQQASNIQVVPKCTNNQLINYAGISPGSGIALALEYYHFGLGIDPHHAHLHTNLGSLLKDLGQLDAAISMYERAVNCDGNFDIALANLANAVKDQGRIAEAITYYRRAVQANPEFAEAVCGLATALNSVCNWYGRGGTYVDGKLRDRIHVDDNGRIQEAREACGWMNRVVEIVDKQLRDGEVWGIGTLTPSVIEQLCQQLLVSKAQASTGVRDQFRQQVLRALRSWAGKRWEGSRVVRLVERAIRQIGWQWYQDRHVHGKEYSPQRYLRPLLPATLSSPTAPTVLPFHTFTTPLSAKQVRHISQRNAVRISVTTLRSSWLPKTVYPPPRPPAPCLNVGYVSSDFNNHPLAHLMQSIFGLHDRTRVQAFCYATTASDNSVHRRQIERETPVFHDASGWTAERIVEQIVKDGIHILVNLNGYTRGAKNEVFAARPAPIHMSFMGFAGTLGAEWCDYVFADSISVLPRTLSPYRRNVDIEDRLHPDALAEDQEQWMYAENVIFARSTFFCVDHKQSAPDAVTGPPAIEDPQSRDALWKAEQNRRWRLRKELFPMLSDTAVILGNFNQLYKIDPSTFCMYLRILAAVPNAILWLLRFPDLGEQNLKSFAREWAGDEVASRVIFTDVAPKGAHITRASIVDLFLDTPECNAHTTAADVIWSGTPIVTWARWEYKMCSRMASSIMASALPEGPQGDDARQDLLVDSEESYERQTISLASSLRYPGSSGMAGRGHGRLMDLRRILWEGRWTSRLFDTKRWVRDIEDAYWQAWNKWERGEGGDIWL